ncbi:MAG: hypothetical protein PVJ39_07650 [Gammaproteobacteria bacterium]|jgi:hypothetical protein
MRPVNKIKKSTLAFSTTILCCGLFLLLTVTTSFAASPVNSAWQGPVQVSNDDTWTSPNAQIVINEHGDGIATWQQYTLLDNTYGIWVARFNKEHGWSTPEKISGNTVGQVGNPPSVAINEHGDAVVAWPVFNINSSPMSTVWSSYFDHKKGWSAPVKIQSDAVDAYSPLVTIDERGNAIAIWSQNNPEYDRTNIYANYYHKNHGWGHSAMIQSDARVLSVDIAIVNNHEGNTVAMWSQFDSNPDNPQTGLVTRSYIKDKGWTSPEFVTREDALSPSIAINKNGKSIVAWGSLNPDTNQYNVKVNMRRGNSTWGDSQLIQSDPTIDAQAIKAAINERGDALVLWRGSTYVYFGTAPIDMYSNVYDEKSGWSTEQKVSDTAPYSVPQLALDENGNAIAVWEKTTTGPNPYVDFHDIYAFYYSPDKGWYNSQSIETFDGDSTYPQLSMTESGDTLAIWEQSSNIGGATLWSNYYRSRHRRH